MILICDSGATSTDWRLVYPDGTIRRHITSGLNPFYQTFEGMEKTVANEVVKWVGAEQLKALHFYGAGFAADHTRDEWLNRLKILFHTSVTVRSDLWAAARGVAQHSEAIVCILGTGSNSCHYNGQKILQNISPLGFILGDEGSGAVIGKRLLADCLKNQMPDSTTAEVLLRSGVGRNEILDRIYRSPYPNRFLASFIPIVAELIERPEIENLVRQEIGRFFDRNVMQYDIARLPVHFTGSIAHIFSTIVRQEAAQRNITVGTIVQSPLDGLVEYHRRK